VLVMPRFVLDCGKRCKRRPGRPGPAAKKEKKEREKRGAGSSSREKAGSASPREELSIGVKELGEDHTCVDQVIVKRRIICE